MSKKYVPSGYQIIDIDLSDRTAQTPFVPETEDEKILLELLESTNYKPILIHIIYQGSDFSGFGTRVDGSISLVSGLIGSSISIIIGENDSKLEFNVVEE